MSEPTEPRVNTLEAQAQLTPGYVARFLFHSFRHSQGNPELQKKIIRYAHLARPAWRITLEDKPKILEITGKMVHAFLEGNSTRDGVTLHQNVTKGLMATNGNTPTDIVREWVNTIEESLSDQTTIDKDPLVFQIADHIVKRDLNYLRKDSGRPRNPTNQDKPLMDPWQSFIVHFGIKQQTTGITELDEMYRDIKAVILKPSGHTTLLGMPTRNGYFLKGFIDLLEIYQKRHPQEAPINPKAYLFC